jgi:cytochrome c-type biogenesis protein CcmH/NrfG
MNLRALAVVAFAAGPLGAAVPIGTAIGLYEHRQYAEASAALQAIVAAEPANAPACYYLGMALSHRGDGRALDDAVPWLKKAVDLDPGNHRYVSDYGKTCFQLADRHKSYLFATRGRDATERAVELDPDDLSSRSALMEFFARAPWPLGSPDKARDQASEIARRNRAVGVRAWVLLGRISARYGSPDRARAAFQAALALDPSNRDASAGLAAIR